ncbi:MAG: tetratricopeptide repeat protein [Deltaproteobacteria bacterium]|jgi:hypothetical protein|nr:tetratricopeptide repeat protein [Deltaproteobacteria bacterium]
MHAQFLQSRERFLGTDHCKILNSKKNLAGVLENLGDRAARDLLLEALEVAARNFGADHPLTVEIASALGRA